MKLMNKTILLLINVIFGGFMLNAQQPVEPGTVQELTNVLNNIQTMMIIAAQIPEKIKTIKALAPKINQEGKCLASKAKQPGCLPIGCANNKECVGAVLNDLIKMLKPSSEAVFGSLERKDTTTVFKPGALYAILDTASKLPSAIPSKYKTTSVAATLTQLSDKVKTTNTKLTTFANNLTAVLEFLDGLAFLLNPAKVIVEKKVELPPIEVPAAELEDIKLDEITIE